MVVWKIRNPEFRRNSAGIPPEFLKVCFLIQNDSDDFSEECTSSEYTPKINRRLCEGFRSYPNSPVFFKACFFFNLKPLRRLTENCPRVSEVTRRTLNFSRLFFDSKRLRRFSEECTSSEYTPKINRRLSEGFRRYPNSPTNKVDSEDISEEYRSSEYTPKIKRKLSEGFRSYPKSPKFFKVFFLFKTTPKIFGRVYEL